MKEIGGYFGLERFDGEEYHKTAVGVNSGRNALCYLLKARGYRKLYLPRFLCDSVARLCDREGVAYEEYAVDASFAPLFDGVVGSDEAVYIVNFFGQITDEQVPAWKARYGNVIFDNVQAFFQKPLPGVDTVYSCRKFFGVPDGGYVAPDARLAEPLEQDGSKDRMEHVLGRFEEAASPYYAAFRKNDETFYELPLRQMSPLTRNLLRGVDYEAVRQRRENNFAVLADALGTKNRLSLVAPVGPYCYPFYTENGMALKQRLAAKGIYVATLWPNVLDYENTVEKDLAENLLPLPCDQRYTADDMRYLLQVLETEMKELRG